MGNHEYCEDCQENSFHMGRDCDPIKKAEVTAERELSRKINKRANERLEQVVGKLLEDNNIEFEMVRFESGGFCKLIVRNNQFYEQIRRELENEGN